MKNVILVALILHLVITVAQIKGNYQFGDIISFPRRCGKISYRHFAVYVGPKPNLFGQGDMDIFHRLRLTSGGQHCVFGKLEKEPEHKKENYLDGPWAKSEDEDIIKHVKAMREHCGNYNLLNNNCEHLATYVRYGKAYLKQPGTKSVSFICRLVGGEKSCPAADDAVKNMPEEEVQKILEELNSNSKHEAQCSSSSSVDSG